MASTTVTAVRLNRRGKVVTTTREHYVRTDLPCQLDNCTTCTDDVQQQPTPERCRRLPSAIQECYVPDHDTLAHYLDLWEETDVTGVLILQSVNRRLQESCSRPLLQRLQTLRDTPSRCFISFPNEHFMGTYRAAPRGESFLETFRKSHRSALEWFASHWNGRVRVTAVCRDEELCRELKKNPCANLRVQSVEEFASAMASMTETKSKAKAERIRELLASLQAAEEARIHESENRGEIYDHYRSAHVLEAGIKSRVLFKGTLHVDSHNPDHAYIRDLESNRIVIQGKVNQNRAIHMDTVAVELVQKSGEDDMRSGRVVGVFNRSWRPYVACLPLDVDASSDYLLAIPMDRRVPRIRIKTRDSTRLQGVRFVVQIDDWPTTSHYPNGHLVRKIGVIGDLECETESLLLEYGVPVRPFPELALRDLPIKKTRDAWSIPEGELKRRRDFRGLDVCSIDPEGCVDIDDALHARSLPNGNIEIGVHIADVTYFVEAGGILDAEARLRGTSVYLIDRRIDMLPAVLSEDLCSLRMGVDRLAVSVVWELTPAPDLQVVHTWFGRSVIRSVHSCSYEQAENMLYGKEKTLPAGTRKRLENPVKMLTEAARVIRKRRFDRGAVDLEKTEVKVMLGKNKMPDQVKPSEHLEMHGVVAEFMILANQCVAEKIHSHYPNCTLLRRHPLPSQDRFDELVGLAARKGIEIHPNTNKELAASLTKAQEILRDDAEAAFVLKDTAVKAMSEAEYFSSGAVAVPMFYHYGLAADFYTHFTSPIRRYADVIVHRLLTAALGEDHPRVAPMSDNALRSVGDHLNRAHRASKEVQRDAQQWFISLYIKNKQGYEDAEGIVVDACEDSVFVLVPKYAIRGRAYVRDKDQQTIIPVGMLDSIGNKDCRVDFNGSERIVDFMVENESKLSLKLFDKVTVRLETAQSHTRLPRIEMKLVRKLQARASLPYKANLHRLHEESVVPSTDGVPEEASDDQVCEGLYGILCGLENLHLTIDTGEDSDPLSTSTLKDTENTGRLREKKYVSAKKQFSRVQYRHGKDK